MRNLKKVLALALVFAMAFTFTAGAAFTDVNSIGTNYVDDVNMLVELGVLSGYPDGSFGPQKNITRAEFAKMAYTLKYGSDTDGNLFAAQASKFVDVEGNANVAWAKGYINYCANQNIVSGVGANKFNPQGNITVAEAAKMILVILGCDPSREGFTGANWMANVTAKAIELGIFNGWSGDPSALATRELVAKLMKNAIFSPVYTYSAVTGAGSQLNALGTAYNKTLGETTMNLKTVTGIVVANERYAIKPVDENGSEVSIYGGNASETGEESGKSVIYYVDEEEDVPAEQHKKMVIDRALSDDMLGAKVNVFFKADKIENNNRYNNDGVEVIGDVLVHSDTVAYTVAASEMKIFPDGETTSTSEIRPYISFAAGGEEIRIVLGAMKVQKKFNAKYETSETVEYEGNPTPIATAVATELGKYGYVINGTTSSNGIITNGNLAKNVSFMDDIGLDANAEGNLSQYRFVSVDGGKTYSYMFQMVGANNSGFGAVTGYNKTNGTIRLSGDVAVAKTYDLEDVELKGDIAVDDAVVAYRANGKVVIEKVEAMRAAPENFGVNTASVILNGNKYIVWDGCSLENETDLFNFYNNLEGASSSSTKYFVYKNMIMEVELSDITEEDTDSPLKYAVITKTRYNSLQQSAYVDLTFADGTSGTYKIGKLYRGPGGAHGTKSDKAEEFDKNRYFGAVVKCRILDDGTVDLSAQNFKSNEFIENYIDGTNVYGTYTDGVFTAAGTKDYFFSIVDGRVDLTKNRNGSSSQPTAYYPKNDDAVLFLIYGNPMYDAETGFEETDDEEYRAITARPYKISEIRDGCSMDFIDDFYMTSYNIQGVDDILAGHVLFDSNTNKTKYVTAASMTVGTTLPSVKFNTTDRFAYILSAKQRVTASGKYAVLEVITDDGAKTLETVLSPVDNENSGMLTTDDPGRIDGPRQDFPAGSFIRYDLNDEGKIKTVDKSGLGLNDIVKGYNGQQHGLFLVNITDVRKGIVTFYDTIYANGKDPIDPATESSASLKFHEDEGCKIITIAGADYAGSGAVTMSSKETALKANTGNAILQVEEGQIIRIFSFVDGYTHNR